MHLIPNISDLVLYFSSKDSQTFLLPGFSENRPTNGEEITDWNIAKCPGQKVSPKGGLKPLNSGRWEKTRNAGSHSWGWILYEWEGSKQANSSYSPAFHTVWREENVIRVGDLMHKFPQQADNKAFFVVDWGQVASEPATPKKAIDS